MKKHKMIIDRGATLQEIIELCKAWDIEEKDFNQVKLNFDLEKDYNNNYLEYNFDLADVVVTLYLET